MTQFVSEEHLLTLKRLAEMELSETLEKRAALLLLYESGLKTAEIAEKVDLSPGRVLYWRREYLKNGLDIFGDVLENLKDEADPEANHKTSGGTFDATDSESSADESMRAPKKPKGSLKKLTRAAKKAGKRDKGKAAIELGALEYGIAKAEKRRKNLKKRLRGLRKKKAERLQKEVKTLSKQIRRAKKVIARFKD